MSDRSTSFRQAVKHKQQQLHDMPVPDAEAQTHSQRLVETIRAAIVEAGGQLSFAEYMQLALYAPGLGYYSAGSQKFGVSGDFVTAPEISPLFSVCIANALQPVLASIDKAQILEVGAGSGVMAADILLRLAELDSLPEHYFILELSADLRQRQQQTLQQRCPEVLSRVAWLDSLPETFSGVVVANELLDAMPVQRFLIEDGYAREQVVAAQEDKFVWQQREADSQLLQRIKEIEAVTESALTDGYVSEVNFNAEQWIKSIAAILQQGMLLLIDYGFPRHEFYHPQRQQGTLMCHYRHRGHDDPFVYPGLQDITTHIDFTAMADAALEAGLQVAGYTTQAHFLLENGLTECLAASDQADAELQLRLANQVKRLTLPQEMGELFKVMALSKNLTVTPPGFMMSDLRHRL